MRLRAFFVKTERSREVLRLQGAFLSLGCYSTRTAVPLAETISILALAPRIS